jgi:hypothetical protein
VAARRHEATLARGAGRGLVLDAGAFIAVEGARGHATKLLARLLRAGVPLVTSGGVVAQVWRGGSGRQVAVAMLLPQVEVVALGGVEAKLVGMVLGLSRTRDAIDGHVVLLARERAWPVLTSDPGDLHAIDPSVELIVA